MPARWAGGKSKGDKSQLHPRDKDYPATLSFVDKQGNRQEWPLKISLRGKFRRVHCTEMPPLRLDFNKKGLEKAGLAKFDDLKLVNFCMGDDRQARDALVKEYLSYRLYNQLTEASSQVQMVKINFKDINTGKKTLPSRQKNDETQNPANHYASHRS